MVARTEDSEVEKGPVVHFSCCFPSAEIVYFRKGKECSWAALYERRALRGPTWHHCCSSCREGICKPHLQQPALQTPPPSCLPADTTTMHNTRKRIQQKPHAASLRALLWTPNFTSWPKRDEIQCWFRSLSQAQPRKRFSLMLQLLKHKIFQVVTKKHN